MRNRQNASWSAQFKLKVETTEIQLCTCYTVSLHDTRLPLTARGVVVIFNMPGVCVHYIVVPWSTFQKRARVCNNASHGAWNPWFPHIISVRRISQSFGLGNANWAKRLHTRPQVFRLQHAAGRIWDQHNPWLDATESCTLGICTLCETIEITIIV